MNKDTIKNVVSYVGKRLKEPSTHASLAVLAGLFGLAVDPGTVGNISLGLAGLFGMIGAAMGDKPEGAS